MEYYSFVLDGIEKQIPIHFKPHEYRGWYDKMSPELMARINLFRQRLGYPISITPARGGIGRNIGRSTTRHNYDRYGEVQAIDLMPSIHEPERWIRIAKEVGLNGIGYYPDWRPVPGIHVDVRGGRFASWGAVRDVPGARQRYVSLATAVRKGVRAEQAKTNKGMHG